MNRLIVILCLLTLIQLTSCAHYALERHSFSYPDLDQQLMREDDKIAKVFLASINDFNGQHEGVESLGIQIGGFDLTQEYLNIVREKFEGRSLLVGMGNFIPLSETPELKETLFHRFLGLDFDLYGVSSRELTLARELTQNKISPTPTFVNSNVFDLTTSEVISDGPLVSHYLIRRNNINFGFISIAPPANSVISGTYFEDPAPAVLRTRTHLIRNQADVIVLLLHHPSGCYTHPSTRNFTCDESGVVDNLIDRLPPNSIDIILTAGEHHSYGEWKNTFILSSPGNGLYLKGMVIAYDREKRTIDRTRSYLMRPTLLCGAFFQLSEDCYIGDSRRLSLLHDDKLRTIQARFLGSPISINR